MADKKYYTLSEEALTRMCGLIRESHSVGEGINDDSVATNSTWSSLKMDAELADCKQFTLDEIANKLSASYVVVGSTDEVVETSYLYLIDNGNDSYDIYILESDNTTVTKIGTTNVSVNLEIDPDTKNWVLDGTDLGVCAEGKSPTITPNADNTEEVYKLDITDAEGNVTTTDNLKGNTGRSISSITKDDDDNIVVTFSDNTTQNIGKLSVDSGVAIYSDYSTLPATISENAIVYCKNDYSDGSTIYSKGFYFADLDTSTYALISNGSGSVSSDWIDIVGKPFEDISPDDFELDSNGVLCLSSTTFDTVNTQLAAITNELSRKATIDDTDNSSTTTTWSASQIQAELDKKAESGSNHNHSNLTNVLDKLSADSNNNLVFDTKIIMSTNVYDINADGKVDSAEKADTIDGLLATIDELNHLQGATSNIQSQIDAISSGVNFKGEFADYATMTATITTPTKGDWVYVLADETQGAMNTQYVYDGTSWIYGGGKTTVNDATDTVKGVIQLAGDLTGVASSPQLATVTTAQTIGYVQSVTIDEKGRVTDITEDTTLAQRIADLEARPQIYVSSTQPTALKDGDIWIEG